MARDILTGNNIHGVGNWFLDGAVGGHDQPESKFDCGPNDLAVRHGKDNDLYGFAIERPQVVTDAMVDAMYGGPPDLNNPFLQDLAGRVDYDAINRSRAEAARAVRASIHDPEGSLGHKLSEDDEATRKLLLSQPGVEERHLPPELQDPAYRALAEIASGSLAVRYSLYNEI